MWQIKVVILLLGLSFGYGVVRAQDACTGVSGTKLVANPDNCVVYHVCSGGKSVQDMSCSSGLYFDESKQSCNMADRVDCLTDICSKSIASGQVRLVASRNDCSRFFVCTRQGADPIPSRCGTSNIFVEESQQCALNGTVKCSITSPSDPRRPSVTSAWCPASGIRLIPNPSSCNWFFLCNGGKSTSIACPSGLAFDVATSKCTTTAAAKCVDTVKPNCPATGLVNVAHPYSCNNYYICLDGKVFSELQCGKTLLYDTTQNRCVPEENATCKVFG